MVKRVMLGNTPTGYDLYVSKPGVDVTTAGTGQLLLGRNTGVSQILAEGYQRIAGPPTIAANQTYTINLPSGLAGLSNLVLWGRLYLIENYAGDGGPGIVEKYRMDYNRETHAQFQIVNGQVKIYSQLSFASGSAGSPIELWCRYVVFRYNY